MFRKIYYISVWVRSVLNSSWNCFAYSDKVCMSLCINFITCFIWGYCGPQFLSKVAFPSFYVFCLFSTVVLWGVSLDGGYRSNGRLIGIFDTTGWPVFIDSISLFRISISFCLIFVVFSLFGCNYLNRCVSTRVEATKDVKCWVFSGITHLFKRKPFFCLSLNFLNITLEIRLSF